MEATFFGKKRQLKREPEWQVAYAIQVHEMVERGAAIKLTDDHEQLEGTCAVCKPLGGAKPSFSNNSSATCVEQQPEVQGTEHE